MAAIIIWEGNEIGMGAVADAVHKYVPHGEIICAQLATDVLLPAGVSNWGCYAIQAALAILSGKPELLHTSALERRLVEAAAGVHQGRRLGRVLLRLNHEPAAVIRRLERGERCGEIDCTVARHSPVTPE